MRLYCFRDIVVSHQLQPGGDDRGADEDYKARGKKIKQRGGIITYVVMAVDLYFIVPNQLGYYAQMLNIREHFKENITRWNEGILEYLPRPLSEATLDETFYKSRLTKLFGPEQKAFAFEISDIKDDSKFFRYHGYYVAGAWREKSGKALLRPKLPEDWSAAELTGLVRALVK